MTTPTSQSSSLPPVSTAASSAMTVLVVDDQAALRALLATELRRAGVANVIEAANGIAALEAFKEHNPDLVLLDVCMPEHDGYWVARELRKMESGDWTPIIFLSSLDTELDVWRGIEAGGDDYLTKPVKPIILVAKIRAMQRLLGMRKRLAALSAQLHATNQKLYEATDTQPKRAVDALTGLVARQDFDEILYNEIQTARKEQKPLTLMLCDLDYFTGYNEALGEQAGDACLREIGKLLKEVCLRPSDVAFRYEGGQFALILPNTPKSGAMTFARAMSGMLRKRHLPNPGSPLGGCLTLSGGITTCIPDANTSTESMVMRAEESLYTAKAQGRERFFSFEMQMDTVEQLFNA